MTPAYFIFLYGPPASGKTVTGLRLAESLHLPFYDLDEVIETQAGSSIPQIFAAEGEAGFREREAAALKGLLNWQRGVVALGGGALLRPENRRLAEAAGTVVCLSASFETIVERLGGGDGERPLLEGEAQDQLRKLLEQRDRTMPHSTCRWRATIAQSTRPPGRRRSVWACSGSRAWEPGMMCSCARAAWLVWVWRCASVS